MEIFQTTAKMQQSQMTKESGGLSGLGEAQGTQTIQQIQKSQINDDKVAQGDSTQSTKKIETEAQMDQLIAELNRSLDPFNTSLQFGFDNNSGDFYVSVIDTQDNRVLRRFPAESAQAILPKMQEITGLLFDERG